MIVFDIIVAADVITVADLTTSRRVAFNTCFMFLPFFGNDVNSMLESVVVPCCLRVICQRSLIELLHHSHWCIAFNTQKVVLTLRSFP